MCTDCCTSQHRASVAALSAIRFAWLQADCAAFCRLAVAEHLGTSFIQTSLLALGSH
jgi:hypothetical protein